MPSNRIPISVRISQEDADFIAQLHIEGAHTPSEKIRELLKQARVAHEMVQDYETRLTLMEQQLYAARHHVLQHEKSLGLHSHIVARILEWLPDLMAMMASEYPPEADKSALVHYEQQAMWRIVRLMNSILQLAITGKGAAYDDKVLTELDNTLKLAKLVSQLSDSERKEITS